MELDDAVNESLALDLTAAEDELRRTLPEVPAADSMVKETSVEFRRWHVLDMLGRAPLPTTESLLSRFIKIVTGVAPSASKVADSDTYEQVFGNVPTYPWRSPINMLCYGGPQPQSGGGDARELSEP